MFRLSSPSKANFCGPFRSLFGSVASLSLDNEVLVVLFELPVSSIRSPVLFAPKSFDFVFGFNFASFILLVLSPEFEDEGRVEVEHLDSTVGSDEEFEGRLGKMRRGDVCEEEYEEMEEETVAVEDGESEDLEGPS